MLLAGAPFQNDDGGVVLELVSLVDEQAAHEAPHHLRGRIAGGDGGGDEVGQPLLAGKNSPSGERASVMPSV